VDGVKLLADNLPATSLAALAEASAAINSSLDFNVVLDAIARSAANVMRAEAASVLLLDERRKTLVFVAAVGDRGEALVGEEFDADLGIAGYVAATAKPELVQNCLLYTSPSPRDRTRSRMPSSA